MQLMLPKNKQYNSDAPRFGKKRLGLLIVVVILLVPIFINRVPLYEFANEYLSVQRVQDIISHDKYTPSRGIQSISNSIQLTDRAQFVFYATQPSLDSRDTFNEECQQKEEKTSILGCYTDNRIYIFNVDDARLDGVNQVTAAHELLHAIYQRMAPSQRDRVNSLLEKEYKKIENQADYKDRMAFYARTEPGERDNELHSIIGTEVVNISPELEEYYAQYLNDRQSIVKMYESYQAVFSSLTTRADQISARLKSLSSSIDKLRKGYSTDIAQLNIDIAKFNSRAARGDFYDQAEFNQQRAALVNRVNAAKATQNQINKLVEEYNGLLDEYNKLVVTSGDLYRSINSTVESVPSV